MLEINGLTSDQVTLVNAYGEQVPGRLRMGVIQAGHSWEPYVSVLQTLINYLTHPLSKIQKSEVTMK